MQKGVSIIICTYNGAKRLPQTLQHIAHQQVSASLQWELIVVDNNSNDNTSEVVLAEWNKYYSAPPLTLLQQPIPGVSYAREMGLKAVKYTYIVICDDDNWLAANYIETVINILDGNANIGIVGGWSTASFEVTPPVWFKDFAMAYAVGKRRETSTNINWLATAGVGIRKEALDQLDALQFQHILSGRKGKALVAGDDLELCAAIRAIGYEVYFSTELHFVHFMSANRLHWSYLKKLVKGSASAQSVFDMYTIIDKMLKKNEPLTFTKVYRKLFSQQINPIRERNSSIGKAIQFWLSLSSTKEGNITKYGNKYFVDYAIYVLLNKTELKLRYNQITSFYSKAKAHVVA